MFCLKCYPALYNGTFGDIVHRGKPNKSDMNELSTLIYRPDIYSCDSNLTDENDLTNKVRIHVVKQLIYRLMCFKIIKTQLKLVN